MARVGATQRPAVARVQSQGRATEILVLCTENDIQVLVGVEPDKAEDISDVERVLAPPAPALTGPKVGRNEPCPCGSGKKFKKCFADLPPPD